MIYTDGRQANVPSSAEPDHTGETHTASVPPVSATRPAHAIPLGPAITTSNPQSCATPSLDILVAPPALCPPDSSTLGVGSLDDADFLHRSTVAVSHDDEALQKPTMGPVSCPNSTPGPHIYTIQPRFYSEQPHIHTNQHCPRTFKYRR